MPRLTQYTRQLTPDNQLRVRRATAEDLGGGVVGETVGRAFAQVGQEVEGFLAKQKQRKDRIDYLEIQKALVKRENTLNAELRKAEIAAAENPEGFAEDFDAIIAQSRNEVFERFSNVSEENRLALEANLFRDDGGLRTKAADFEARGVVTYQKNSIKEFSENIQNAVRNGDMEADEGIRRMSEFTANLRMQEAVSNPLLQAETENITLAGARGDLARAETLEEVVALEESIARRKDALSSSSFNTLMNSVDTAKKRISAASAERAQNSLRDAVVVLRDGGDVPDVEALVAAAHPDDEDARARAMETLRVAQAEGEFRNEIVMESPDAIEGRLEDLDRQIDNPALSLNERADLIESRDRLQVVYAQRQREIIADPAQYVLDNDPMISDRKSTFDQDRIALQEAIEAGADEKTVGALEVKAARSRDAYVSQLVQAQKTLGVEPYLLTKTEVQQVAAIADAVLESDTGPQQLVDEITNLKNQYGPQNFRHVYRQLAEEEALSGSHMVLGRIAGDPLKAATTTSFSAALGASDQTYFDQLPDLVKADLDKSIAKTMSGLNVTLAAQNGQKTAQQYTSAIRTYALYMMTRNPDLSMEDAVTGAANRLVLEDYAISDKHAAVRYPRAVADNKARFESALDVAIQNLPEVDLIPPADSGMSPKDFGFTLRSGGNVTWVTAPGEDGVIMVSSSSGSPIQVRNASGRSDILKYTWEELDQLLSAERTKVRSELQPSPDTGFGARLPAEQIEAERGRD